MAQSFTGKKRIRKSFGRIPEAVQMPNLIEVQRSSYEQFLQRETRSADRRDEGIEAVFKSVFPIKDFNERACSNTSLRVRRAEVRRRGMRPARHDLRRAAEGEAAPHRVRDRRGNRRPLREGHQGAGRLHGRHPAHDGEGHLHRQRDPAGHRLQMHRSPGVFFDHDKGKTHASGKLLFAARVIPYRGSWLDFEFDAKDIVFVRIDRRRKLPATTFLMALGMDGEEILSTFYATLHYAKRAEKKGAAGGWATAYQPDRWRGMKPDFPLIDADTGEEIAPAGTKISARNAKKFADAGLKTLLLAPEASPASTWPATWSTSPPAKSTPRPATS